MLLRYVISLYHFVMKNIKNYKSINIHFENNLKTISGSPIDALQPSWKGINTPHDFLI